MLQHYVLFRKPRVVGGYQPIEEKGPDCFGRGTDDSIEKAPLISSKEKEANHKKSRLVNLLKTQMKKKLSHIHHLQILKVIETSTFLSGIKLLVHIATALQEKLP